VIVAVDEVIELELTVEITGSVTGLLTVTGILLVVVLPAVSVAIALSVCNPFVAAIVFHVVEYAGPAPVTALPRFAPSN
jgi:hypothetical protein